MTINNFDSLACAIGALEGAEAAAGSAIGGHSSEASRMIAQAWRAALSLRATSPFELLWKVRQLGRAVENDWTLEATMPVLNSIAADIAAMHSDQRK